jgi:SAM-dependent methyltransferase
VDPSIVCCPRCRGALEDDSDGLRCAACDARYGTVDGVPDLVIGAGALDEPRRGARLLHAIVANPQVYDLAQRGVGTAAVRRRIAPALAETAGETVLDVGGGTGALAALLHPTARYVWLDSDPRKLEGLTAHRHDAILANALKMAVRDDAVDAVVCSAVSHHVDDENLPRLFGEMRRIARRRLFFLDAVRSHSPVGTALWRLDRGAYARPAETLLAALEREFRVESVDRFTVLHRYVFVVASPR